VLRIRDVFIPNPYPNIFHSGPRIITVPVHKKSDEKLKLPFFLLLTVSGASFNSKRDYSSRIPKKFILDPGSGSATHQKDVGSAKNSSQIRIPNPEGKKHRIPDPDP
jgi:hypothetical protein